MEDPTPAITGNGQPGEEVRLVEDPPAIAGLRSEMEALQRERDHYQAKIDRIAPSLKRYEKAITILEGGKLGAGGRPAKDSDAPSGPKSKQKKTTGISEERLELLKEAITQWIEDHGADEFRQVDIRGDTSLNLTSGLTAIGFERLRQEGFLRFARQSGNNKYFRLTRETLKAT